MTSEQIIEAWAVHEGDDYLEVYVTTFTNNPTVYNVPHPSTEDRRRANVAAAAPEMLAAQGTAVSVPDTPPGRGGS